MADIISVQTRKTETITLTLGTAKLIQGPRGEKGDTGPQGTGIESAVLNEDYTLTLLFTDGSSYTTPPIRGERGERGATGAQGFRGEQGFTGPQGIGIASIELTQGDHTPGTTDTYTITLDDGRSAFFTVYNGLDGDGAGDMQARTYDPTGRRTDIFAYAEKAALDRLKRFVQIGGGEPQTGPVLWFDTGARGEDAVMLWLGEDEDTALVAKVSERDWPVTNVSPHGMREEENVFYIEVS